MDRIVDFRYSHVETLKHNIYQYNIMVTGVFRRARRMCRITNVAQCLRYAGLSWGRRSVAADCRNFSLRFYVAFFKKLCRLSGTELFNKLIDDITWVGRMIYILLFVSDFLQAGVWQNLLIKGIPDVMYPAAFKLAIVLRHTPSDLVVNFLGNMLHLHPQSVSTYWFSYHLPSHLIF